ncbi:MAG: RIP metalloprotease [Pseudomonadota bacterium]
MDSFFTQGPISVLSLIFLLGVVVVVHELGHYWAGRMFGAAAESFSVGFGRSIFERKDSRNTRWRINWIPLGGFVKFVGEHQMPGDAGRIETAPVGRPFSELTVGQRSIVLLAGPVANFILAIFIFAALAFSIGKPIERVSIGLVNEGGPAAEAGIEVGDIILAIDGREVTENNQVRRTIQLSTGDELIMTIERNGVPMDIGVTPVRMAVDNGLGQINQVGAINVGLGVLRVGHETFGPITAIQHGIVQTADVIALTGKVLLRMMTGREPLNQLSGPVGIGDLAGKAVTATLSIEEISLSQRLWLVSLNLINICAFVSVGIGLFNLLPLPVLDGGHLAFNAYEAVVGEAVPVKIQETALTIGLALLFTVAVFVTWGDIVETGILGGA